MLRCFRKVSVLSEATSSSKATRSNWETKEYRLLRVKGPHRPTWGPNHDSDLVCPRAQDGFRAPLGPKAAESLWQAVKAET